MSGWKAIYITLFVLAASLFGAGHKVASRNSYKKIEGQAANSLIVGRAGEVPSKVRYEVCAREGDVIYYCPGDGICCTPGDPASKCCPEAKPLCLPKENPESCCPRDHPKLCGLYCCEESSSCCNGENCCDSVNACCGAQCCPDEAPCCKQGETSTCCDKITTDCCDGYGCVPPCPSQFDAIGCQLSSLSLDDKLLEASRALPENLYRILRPDENPEGIVAKNPGAKKTVLSHVNCGSRPKYASQFISTSASLEVAKYYKQKGEEKGLTGLRICEFEVDKLPEACEIVDLTTEETRDRYLGNAVCKNFAKASAEVLLQCDEPIPCTVIDSPPKRDSKNFADTRHQL